MAPNCGLVVATHAHAAQANLVEGEEVADGLDPGVAELGERLVRQVELVKATAELSDLLLVGGYLLLAELRLPQPLLVQLGVLSLDGGLDLGQDER